MAFICRWMVARSSPGDETPLVDLECFSPHEPAGNHRHLPGIRCFDAFWRLVRPFYDRLILRSAAGQGLSRRMNGMDDILLARFPQVSSDA